MQVGKEGKIKIDAFLCGSLCHTDSLKAPSLNAITDYHITHLDNLTSIVLYGGLLSNTRLRARNQEFQDISYGNIQDGNGSRIRAGFPPILDSNFRTMVSGNRTTLNQH
ncbi:DarT ssDNA thymidine ADP-ribosyltransferase family protein [Stenomitos frigidus]